MSGRTDNIIYQLAASETPMTADALAKKLAVSSRTVKSEMTQVREELKRAGAVLQAKRNEGYSLIIQDEKVFENFFTQLQLRTSVVNNYYILDGQARFLYVTRKLISSSKYVRIEDLADEMFISRSALRKSLTEAMIFLKSFNLEWENRTGLGIRCFGKEYHVRIAMVELFAVHFHKAVLDDAGMEYSKWLECDYEERQNIRHNFLKTLRESGIRTSDIMTQKLSIYLLIVRNRARAGYRLWLEENHIREIKKTKEYHTARRIFDNLKEAFEGYDLMDEEVQFFAIYLLSQEDISYCQCMKEAHPEERFPMGYKKAERYSFELLQLIKDELHIDLYSGEKARCMLVAAMIPVLAQFHYELHGFKNFWYYHENYTMRSAVALKIARVMADYIQQKEGKNVSISILLRLVSVVYCIIAEQDYDICPMKLLLVSSGGIDGNEINKKRLLSRYERVIKSFTFAELYEIRGMDTTEYDAVLFDMVDTAYNYDLPYSNIHVIPLAKEMDKVFNNILLKAYRFNSLLPEEKSVQVYKDFCYADEKQFFQFISFRHCRGGEKQKRMEELLTKNEELMTHRSLSTQAAVIIGDYELTGEENVELYCLLHEGLWANEKIRYILYVCVDWNYDIKRLKAMENAVYQLANEEKNLEIFQQDKTNILENMVYQCIKSI